MSKWPKYVFTTVVSVSDNKLLADWPWVQIFSALSELLELFTVQSSAFLTLRSCAVQVDDTDVIEKQCYY